MFPAIVIPARYASTRFPGKPLHKLVGKPMIQHVWERCRLAKRAEIIIIATDDDRIRQAAENFGARVVMTSPDHPSGTDRIAEAANALPQCDVFLNVQGDEPLVSPELIDQLLAALENDPDADMVTAAVPESAADGFTDPNAVKVVTTADGIALYFSRSPIPHRRDPGSSPSPWLRHKGIYAYRRDFLQRFVSWPPSPLEQSECLEQLRALEHGARIRVIATIDDSPGIDTPQQAEILEKQMQSQNSL